MQQTGRTRRDRNRARRLRLSAVALLSTLVAGCASDEAANRNACPAGTILRDAAHLTAFRGEGRDLTDNRYEVRIADIAVACNIDSSSEGQTVRSEVKLLFEAEKGPANRTDAARFTYFVAIADNQRNILARETFDVRIPLPGNTTRNETIESLIPTLPLPAEARPGAYRIIAGLELNRDQLRYNRRDARAE